MKRTAGLCAFLYLFQVSLFAKCPVTDGATLVLRAPVGNLLVDTSGTDAVEVQVSNKQIGLAETCGKSLIEVTGTVTSQIQDKVDWKIRVPRSVHLDLVTQGGDVNIGDSDGNIVVRTTGGNVVVGNIKGRAAVINIGGSIKAGNIGGNAELRAPGGSLEVGNVAGTAEFQAARTVDAGTVDGRVKAETDGGSITIKGAHGDLVAHTGAGDITIGTADGRIDAKAGGKITNQRVRGPFQGHTESGDIRLESAGSWVEASTGYGNIFLRLVPENIDGDLHMDLQTGVGDVIVYLPQRLKATIDAMVERPAFEAQKIPPNSTTVQGLASNPGRFYSALQSRTTHNGGGNPVKLHISLGKYEINWQ